MLPEREERTFWIDGEVLRAGGPPGGLAGRDAETIVDGGWLLPGLVDVHTHPGAPAPDSPFDEELLRRQLGEHRDAGVLAVRTPGTAQRMPAWVAKDPELPHVTSAGRWLATPDGSSPASDAM